MNDTPHTDTPPQRPGMAPLPLAVGLGLLALVPFAIGVYYAYTSGVYDARRALDWLLAYLALIVAFIGGVQWGRMLAQKRVPPVDMGLAVIPAIAAWPGLLLHGVWAFCIQLGVLIFAWMLDERGYRKGWQGWRFLQLRRVLTLVVAGCVIAIGWRVMRGW